MIDFIATRNIITHNRGHTDERYLRVVPSRFVLGAVRQIDTNEFLRSLQVLTDCVIATDAAAAAKFRLEVTEVAGPAPVTEID
jgi:hypothetical protein